MYTTFYVSKLNARPHPEIDGVTTERAPTNWRAAWVWVEGNQMEHRAKHAYKQAALACVKLAVEGAFWEGPASAMALLSAQVHTEGDVASRHGLCHVGKFL